MKGVRYSLGCLMRRIWDKMNEKEFDMLKVNDKVRNTITGHIFTLKDKNTYSKDLGSYFLGVRVQIKTTRIFRNDVWEKVNE